jgi:glyoxylase I family protein
MNLLKGLHHVAIIVTDIEVSKKFYCEKLGFKIISETFRAGRGSWKVDLALGDSYLIELFTFPDAPARPSRPEAIGLRHLAFATTDLAYAIAQLEQLGVAIEPVRTDELTGKKFTFFADPDGLPLELYEC